MLARKIIIFFSLLSITGGNAAPSSPAVTQKAATQKLIAIAATIQKHEAQLSVVEHDLERTREEEKAILSELEHYNHRLMDTIHYLRHATQFSPLLAMLSASKPDDVIHSSMLLRSITPEIHIRNQQLLEKVKYLSNIRTQLEAKKNELHDLTFHYHQERDTLNSLLTNRSTGNLLPDDKLDNDGGILTLKTPVSGKLIPTYGNSSPEWASFTQGVLFVTRPGAHVVAPISGKIAFAGDYAKGQGKMIIVETSNSHVVMSGLGSLNCTLGQNIAAGEPIGRMTIKQRKTTKGSAPLLPQLYLEVWHQEKTVNPQSVLKDQRSNS
ncbi:MAG: peptidoglycan DD-metalloendopeptidase family protein [Alphaproteobacteria bacterium]|jgi:septal ring factor EnvC (AmiA/AmiB activator)|nr:peptidoglycan DD-metalloendopeptidase family protein [Alphaproteobacteria bacterium]